MKPIVRGKYPRSLLKDCAWLIRSIYYPLNSKKIIENFESSFSKACGQNYCVAFPYARSAIYFILKNLNLKPGDKVLMPPITIKGILDVVLELKLSPIFVDIDKHNLIFETDKLQQILETEKPKVAIVTYLFGINPGEEAIEVIETLKRNKIFVIEDFSQNFNVYSMEKKLGTMGDIGVYSSSSLKTIDTYGGGLVITNNSEMFYALRVSADNLRKPSRKNLFKKIFSNCLKSFLTKKYIFNYFTFPIIKFSFKFSEESFARFVGNRSHEPIANLPTLWFEKYTSLQAKVGLQMLNSVVSRDDERIKVGKNLDVLLDKYKDRPHNNKLSQGAYWQFIIYVDDYFKLAKPILLKNKIDSGLTSLVLLSNLNKYNLNWDTPNAKRLYFQGVYLPCYASLQNQEIKRISDTVLKLRS